MLIHGQHLIEEVKQHFATGQFQEAATAARRLVSTGAADQSIYLLLAREAISRAAYSEAFDLIHPWRHASQHIRERCRLLWLATYLSRDVKKIHKVAAELKSLAPRSQFVKEVAAYTAVLPRSVEELLLVRGTESVLPFLPGCVLPVVQISLSNRKFNFLLDTGADDMMLSMKVVCLLNLKIAKGSRGLFAGGYRAELWRSFLPELNLGSASLLNVPVTVLPHIPQLGDECPQLDGVIGAQLFRRFLPTWDYEGNRLQLMPTESPVERGTTVQLPLRCLGSHILVVNARVDDKLEGLFFLDSGGTFGLALDRKAWTFIVNNQKTMVEVGMGGGGEISYWLLPDRCLQLGGIILENILVVGGVFPEVMKGWAHTNLRGIISHGVLSRFRQVTIDYHRLQLFLK